MSKDPLYPIRREAQERGLRFADVQAAYWEVKENERGKRRRPNEVREMAWMMHTASQPGCWPFWRHGFCARFGRQLARGQDHTCVPGYDEIGQQIATAFPEYQTDDGTERLWDFLFSQYDRMPSREEMMRRAMDRVEWELAHNAAAESGIPGLEF